MKRRQTMLVASVAIAMSCSIAVPTSAWALETPPSDADTIADIVADATPDALQAAEIPATEGRNGALTATGLVKISIPGEADEPIIASALPGAASNFVIKVGTGTSASTAAQLADDGSVVYTSDDSSTDQTVQPTNDGVRIHTVLKDRSAPTEIFHHVTLPAGARLVSTDQLQSPAGESAPAGAVYVLDSSGKFQGGFSAPWAVAADGVAVPTHYEVRGNDLVQVVEHTADTYQYPVVADPYLGKALIQGTKWVSYAEGLTLQVTPTTWARQQAGGYVPGSAGWDELLSRRPGITKNANGMRDQYICHQQIVAVRALNKPTWNLDEWRPDVGYAGTVNASCNPGGAKWFD